MKRLVAMFVVGALLVGCGPRPAEHSRTPGGYEVTELFTHDGCTVYRFQDFYSRYFVRCRDGSASTEWREGSKSSRPQGIATAVVR